ncbi:MAG: DNA primase [Candidatus Moraniibacteriota bacterium]|nr:MAG: DNA primase [Candidatus Moranbacteria bacterium]
MAMDQVEEVKSKVDIVEIIGSRVTLKKAGRHFKGLCPFHSEKSPSFIVSPERQSYKCFGCQEGGDVLTFLQKYEGYSFLEALESMAAKVGVTLQSYRPTEADSRRKKILEILSLASEYYSYLLNKHESGSVARDYLAGRGIRSESIKKFNLGYSPSQWRSVSDFLIKKKGYRIEEVEASGLIIIAGEGKYYDRFRGRVMFPLKDHKGVVVGFSGRTLSKDPQEAKYINSPETSTYHKSQMLYGLYENREAIRKEDKIVLVEGELDMIPSVQANVPYVVAIKGSAFTAEQAQIISRYSRNVYMSLDADSAGQEAIKRAVVIAETLDLSIRVVQIKGGKDPGDVAGENPTAWREMVKKAVLYWDFLIDSASAKSDPKSGEGAGEITREVIPALSQIANKVVQAHYVRLLATKLGVGESVVYEEIGRFNKKQELTHLRSVVSNIEQGAGSRSEELALYALSLLLQNFEMLRKNIEELELEWVGTSAVAKIISALVGWEREKFEIKEFAGKLPPELMPTLDLAYLRDLTRVSDVMREWEGTVHELEEVYVRERLKEITKTITSLNPTENERLQVLQNDFGRYSRRLSDLTK